MGSDPSRCSNVPPVNKWRLKIYPQFSLGGKTSRCHNNSYFPHYEGFLVRQQIDKQNIKEICVRILTHTKYCIIFHNFIEYNTISKLVIDICEENLIPYFIFSEHCEKFYFNGVYIEDLKFKKCIKNCIKNCIKTIEYS